ncbi:MAG: hypothetical protein NWE89_16555 [Candidatus Bathyarchaeota archaeon]|nr:hypothetical protein [Candidatus Bathyarchaeota archaeon]
MKCKLTAIILLAALSATLALMFITLAEDESATFYTVTGYQMGLQGTENLDLLLVNTSHVDPDELNAFYLQGVTIVFLGDHAPILFEVFTPSISMENPEQMDISRRLHATGIKLVHEGNRTLTSVLRVTSTSSQFSIRDVYDWDTMPDNIESPGDGSRIEGYWTDVDTHLPYGKVTTRTEVLRTGDTSEEHDWYDVSVEQKVQPGASIDDTSAWKWRWLVYSANATMGATMSDYDPPLAEPETPALFRFLWQILRFRWIERVPWLVANKPKVLGFDQSDFSLELYRVKHEAEDGYNNTGAYSLRHHYVLRTVEGEPFGLGQWTQVKYVKGEFVEESHFTPIITKGVLVNYP